jgi:ribosomal protein S18 acetylase RimI-like enzyme
MNSGQDRATRYHTAAIEENVAERVRFFSRSAEVRSEVDPQVVWASTGIPYPNPILNLVLCKRFSPSEIHAQVHQVQELAQQPGAPLYWTLNPDMTPADLVEELKAHEWTFVENVWGMAMDLSLLPESAPAMPPGLEIGRVSSLQASHHFIRVVANQSVPSPDIQRRWLEFEIGLGFDDSLPWQRYLGCQDGQPVATAAMFFGRRSAGLYHVATLPEARGRGIGSAITYAALKEGVSRGYRLAVLIATPMGINIYRKLGFQTYSTLDLFVRPGSGGPISVPSSNGT